MRSRRRLGQRSVKNLRLERMEAVSVRWFGKEVKGLLVARRLRRERRLQEGTQAIKDRFLVPLSVSWLAEPPVAFGIRQAFLSALGCQVRTPIHVRLVRSVAIHTARDQKPEPEALDLVVKLLVEEKDIKRAPQKLTRDCVARQ